MTVDFSKLNTIGEIKNVQENGKNVFEDEEKDLFLNDLIKNDIANARKAAELLIKIKNARKAKKKNSALLLELETEEEEGRRGSIVYQVLNDKGLVRDTVNILSLLNSSLPEDKTKREVRIAQLEKEIGEKRAEKSTNDIYLLPLEEELEELIKEREAAKKTWERRKSLSKVLGGGADPKIFFKGSEENLSGISGTDIDGKIGDYDTLANLTSDNPTKITGLNALQILQKAEKYLTNIVKLHGGKKIGPGIEYKKTKVSYFNNRNWQAKGHLVTQYENIGYGVLKALRSFGIDKLKKIITDSGATGSQKTKLEGYAQEIVNCIHWYEQIGGVGYHFTRFAQEGKETNEGWEAKFDSWQTTLLRKKTNEYPYVPAIDWEHVFEFMTSVFPINSTTGKLLTKPYLDDSGNKNYLAPTDVDKGWSEEISIKGYSSAPTTVGKTIMQYAKESGTPDIVKSEIKKANQMPKEWRFSQILQIWYDTFEPFVDFSTNKWRTSGDTLAEEELENMRNELRFCKTMRELFLVLGLSSEIDEFDDYLLEIADRAEKGKMMDNDRKAITNDEGYKGILELISDAKGAVSFAKAFAEGKVWKDDYSEGRSKLLTRLIDRSESKYLVLKNKVGNKEKQIADYWEKKTMLSHEIKTRKREIDILKGLDDFQDKPLPDKKEDFNKIYNKKTQGEKWYMAEIRQMRAFLGMIKEGMESAGESDKFISEGFENKQTELDNLNVELEGIYGKIMRDFETITNSTKNRLPSEGVKEIIKKLESRESGVETLETIAGYFKALEEKIKLDELEQASYDEIKKGISNPGDYKNKVPSGLDKAALTQMFSFDVDDNLKSKWTTAVDGQTIGKDKINSIILDNYGPGKTKHDNLLSHLVDTGDGFEGKKDASYKSDTSDNKKATWKKFIEKGPEVVIKTIVNHEFESEKDTVRTEMEEKKENDQPLKDDVYKKGSDGKFEDASVKQYMYERKIGKSHQFAQKPQNDDDRGDGSTPQEMSVWKEWFGFGVAWKSTIAYVGILLLIAAVLGAIFWQNITDWWNGPAEEHGKSETDEEEKEEE